MTQQKIQASTQIQGIVPAADLPISTDGTMAANSATLVPSQSAVVSYVGSMVGMIKIAQTVVSGSSTSVVTFSSVPQTYSQLLIVFQIATAPADATIAVNFNGDSTSGHYAWTEEYGQDSTTGADDNLTTTAIKIAGGTYTSPYPTSGQIMVPNYAGSTLYKGTFGQYSTWNGTHYYTVIVNGLWGVSSAITSVSVTALSADFAAGSVITLYGIP